MIDPFTAGRMIANRGDLKRRAVNFRRGQELRLTPELRGKIEQVIVNTQSEFEAAAVQALGNMRDAWNSAAFNQVGRANYYEWIRDLALELKGQGGLFNYPLLTLYADVLKQLTEGLSEPSPRLHRIIGLNIEAIGVVIANRLSGPGGVLERKVAEALRDAHAHFRLGNASANVARRVASAVRQLDGEAQNVGGKQEVLPPLTDTARQWPRSVRLPLN